MSVRAALLEQLAGALLAVPGDRAVVAVDGVDGSGKTMVSDELATCLEQAGRAVVRASVDGFHNPRAVRYRRGREDPEGFFHDSYDYAGLRRHLVDPFRAGAASVATARFDYRTDREIQAVAAVPDRAILLLDGIFLHRDELFHLWDASIFLEVPFVVTYARMAVRDGSDPNPAAPGNRRYLEGQRLYLDTCRPQARATYLIDNAHLDAPRLLRLRGVSQV